MGQEQIFNLRTVATLGSVKPTLHAKLANGVSAAIPRYAARAIRRAGELLKQLEPGTKHNAKKQSGVAPTLFSRTDAAREAGMSEWQQKQAVRVANIPEQDFVAQVAADRAEVD